MYNLFVLTYGWDGAGIWTYKGTFSSEEIAKNHLFTNVGDIDPTHYYIKKLVLNEWVFI